MPVTCPTCESENVLAVSLPNCRDGYKCHNCPCYWDESRRRSPWHPASEVPPPGVDIIVRASHFGGVFVLLTLDTLDWASLAVAQGYTHWREIDPPANDDYSELMRDMQRLSAKTVFTPATGEKGNG